MARKKVRYVFEVKYINKGGGVEYEQQPVWNTSEHLARRFVLSYYLNRDLQVLSITRQDNDGEPRYEQSCSEED